MSIAAVTLRGYGPAASIPFVVTAGYSIGTAPPAAALASITIHDFAVTDCALSSAALTTLTLSDAAVTRLTVSTSVLE